MKFLVDANVVSEPTKSAPDEGVVAWLRTHEPDLAVSPIVLGELRYGIRILPAGKRRAALTEWFEAGARRLPVIDFDAATASAWAELLASLKRRGKAMPIKDSLIAATAKHHGLAVATHNTADFRWAGVRLVDPFKA